MRTSEVLNKAADIIEERGWAKGNCAMRPTGPTCLEGALGAAIDAPTRPHPAFGEMYAYSAVQASPAYAAVRDYLATQGLSFGWVWNDQQTSADPVIATLRAAALIEAAKEQPRHTVYLPEADLAAHTRDHGATVELHAGEAVCVVDDIAYKARLTAVAG